jgi:5-methylcytosine-specific restriction endonuclease McrA
MDAATRQFVRRRAGERCEYCRLPQAGHDERLSIDHVIPSKHGRDDAASNLAFACLRCNLYKGTNLSGIDPMANQVTALFNPRQQAWREHFAWSGALILGQTPVGRATVVVMRMNAPERVSAGVNR